LSLIGLALQALLADFRSEDA